MNPIRCFVGLGSNLSTPVTQLKNAISAISKIADTRVVCCSSLYASQPMGPQDQPDYVNAVVELTTTLSPIALLDELQAIELQQGRQRNNERWGPRTLDLDIILFGQHVLNSERLVVPHYGLKEREFVLYPLHEIAPDLMLPCGNSLISALNNVSKNGLTIVTLDVNWERNDPLN